jgi:alcohol dehydrogenase class IV
VGALYDTHHGTTNAVVMPMVLRFNRAEIADKLALAAKYLEIDGGFDGFYDFVVTLRRDLGVPETLGDLGVGRDRFDELAAMAVEDPSAGGNPVKLTVENVKQLLDACV